MNVCILAGGFGTRLMEETEIKPKPMVDVGGSPILWHIMKGYKKFGHRSFHVATGYKAQMIEGYFATHNDDWLVNCVDTGLNTGTGGRLKKMASLLGAETFMMTYGDGVCDVDLDRLLAFHRAHGKLATITAVRPPARFGALVFDGDKVTNFVEKSQANEGWINGGFFVLEPKVLDYIDSDAMMFEQKPLERLAAEGQLMAYRHDGFWQCMDTLRDMKLLNNLWDTGKAPWKVW